MKKVIVFGSLNMDLSIHCDKMPLQGETINGDDFFTTPGGKGANQAVAAAKSKADTTMIGCVGHDLYGQEILETLKKYQVHSEHVDVTEATSTGVAVILRSNHDNRIVLHHGANYQINREKALASLNEVAGEGDIFLTQLENPMEDVLWMLQKAKEKGMMTVMNPAPAQALSPAFYDALDLVVVNETECEVLTGILPVDETTYQQALDAFLLKGVQAIITLGTKGSITNCSGVMMKIGAYPVDAVDTTAAGDSFLGALCSELAQEKDICACLEYATKVAALTVTKKGAQISIATREDVEAVFGDN